METQLNIIVDTREQAPWSFSAGMAECSRGTLKTGDYALKGDDAFAIERKSLDDFLGTISTGWPRFCRELNRMDEAGFPAKVIIIESEFSAICFSEDGKPPRHNHPMLTPQFIVSRIASLTMRGASVLFADSPDFAAAVAYSILKKRYEALNGNNN